MTNYRLNPIDNGLYQFQRDQFGRGYWMRVATYPPGMEGLAAVVNWYQEREDMA